MNQPLRKAVFVDRPNRFLIHCRLLQEESFKSGEIGEKANEIVVAHLADPGRLKEILTPGRIVWLRASNDPRRKTRWSAVLSETSAGGLVSLDTTLPNRLIARALAANELEEFAGWSLYRSEFTLGDSRWDFLLTGTDGCRLVLEVKSVTLVEEGVGLFPDAVTARGRRHLQGLADIAHQTGWKAAVLFVVQREDVTRIEAAHEIDPHFAQALHAAKCAGVNILGRKCRVMLSGLQLGERVPFC